MNKLLRKTAVVFLAALMVLASLSFAFADSPWDEILNYIIVADVNMDGTVTIGYHIDWKALRDDNGKYPLEDVYIGIPNDMFIDIIPISDNIKDWDYDYSKGAVHIFFDKPVYAGNTISFEFGVIADYMYEMNAVEAGYTLFYFVPGWFDEIAIDNLEIHWNAENASSWSSGALTKDGYLTWQVSLSAGSTFPIKVSYPNDAYEFSPEKSYNDPYGGGGGDYDDDDDGDAFFRGLVIFGIIFLIVRKRIKSIREYSSNSGFAKGETKTKVTRTKVEYYPNCPGCGAQRKEGQKTCEYCGRSLVKSEEIIEESKAKDEDKEALKYKKNGEYAYSSTPNTYVRVNVIHTPVSSSSSHSSSSRSSGNSHTSSRSSSSRSSGSSHSSSCVHSSCACACASCACACACACAGGGRAGCSTKDFYNTKLKLSQLERKAKKR